VRRKKIFATATAAVAFIALNILFASLKTDDSRSSAISCILNLQRVGAALSQYVSSHNSDAFPDSLETLVAEHLISPDALKCPASRTDYGYIGGIPLDAPTFLFLVWCENEHNISPEKTRPVFVRMPLLADLGDVRAYESSYFSERLIAVRKYSEIASLTGEDGTSRLLEIGKNERDPYITALAIWKLGTFRRPELSETFARYLAPSHPDVQFESARALARIGDRRGAETLVLSLHSSSYPKRRQAFLSLQILTNGETFGYNPLLPDKAQSESLNKWQMYFASFRK
jgi:hypothetical protein